MTEKKLLDENPFSDDTKAPAVDEAKAPEKKTSESKPKAETKKDEKTSEGEAPKRRTKEEKLADDIAAAKALLKEHGEGHGSKGDYDEVDFAPAVQAAENGVLSAVSGIVTGTIDSNSVAVPVLRLSMVGWIGSAPLEIAASTINDVRKVLDDLEAQAAVEA